MKSTLMIAVAIAASVASATAQTQPPQTPPQGGGQGRGGQRGRVPQRPQRDAQAQRDVPTGTAVISGRVLAADTSRPVKRARVIATGAGRPFAATTDDQGRFTISGLPAANYSIVATKSGFVDAALGQRRALRFGTPVTIADGQQLGNIEIKLSRGGVITGRIADEDGEPLARALVSVMRYQYIRGERQLTPAGVDQTDDRGQYRIYGLSPGEYYVSATTGVAMEQALRNVLEMSNAPQVDAAQNVGYAPTYYPGVMSPAEAMRMKVTAGQEVSNIDFQVQLVSLSTVKGVVTNGSALIMLVPDGATIGGGGGRGGAGRGLGGIAEVAGAFLRGNQSFRTTSQADGTFVIQKVPPGSYTIVARASSYEPGSRRAGPPTAIQPVQVAGQEVMVSLTLAPAVTMSGTITLEATAGALPNGFSGFRINPQPIGAALSMPGTARPGTPDERGAFTVSEVVPGRYIIRANGPRGWVMKAVYVDGRDVTDESIEVKGEPVTGVNVIFTDKISTVTGTVRGARGEPGVNQYVIVFPSDEKLWFPQSRYIDAARTDGNGVYRISGLPAGSYLIVAIDDVEQGEWFDPAFLEQVKGAAAKITIREGEVKTQDFKGP